MVIDFKDKEKEALDELRSLVERIRKFEEPVRKMLLRKYPAERAMEAEGKKAVLSVTGLRYHEEVIFLEISELSIKNVEPFDEFDTWIEADVGTVLRVLRGLLSGQNDAFSEALGSNTVKIRGRKTYHDMAIFSEVFNELAASIRKFKSLRE